MSLATICNVTVSVNSKTVTQKSFGVPMLVGYFDLPSWPANVLIKTYEDDSAMVVDGFNTDHPLCEMMRKVKSQDPSPPLVKVGRLASYPSGASLPHAQSIWWTPLVTTEGTVYEMDFQVKDGGAVQSLSYTVLAAASVASICTDVQALIDAFTGIAASDDTTRVTITPENGGDLIDISGYDFSIVDIRDKTPDPGYGTFLSWIKKLDADWYGFAVDCNSEAIAAAVEDWTEANGKVFATNQTATGITNVGTTDDAFSTAQGFSYARSFGLYKADSLLSYAGAASLGAILPRNPGSYTVCYKTLAGVAADELLGLGDTVIGKGGNTYETVAGVSIIQPGQMFGGTFIDQTIGLDWLVARMQEALFSALVNNPKIPYTDSGIDALRTVALGIMHNAQNVGLLDPSEPVSVTAPLVADIPANDRAARRVPGFVARGRIAGAIHTLSMNIDLTI